MFDTIIDRETRIKLARERANLEYGIRHNTERIILQSMAIFLFFGAGLYYARQNSILVPLVMAPATKHATSEMSKAISQRKRQMERLQQLSRE